MENVTIQSVVAKKTGANNGRPWTISECVLSDGRKVDTFDSFTQGETASVEITPNTDPKYNANMKRPKSQGQQNAGNFANAQAANNAINFNKEKDERISMLSCISSAANVYAQRTVALDGARLTEQHIMDLAKKFFDLAVQPKGVDQLPF